MTSSPAPGRRATALGVDILVSGFPTRRGKLANLGSDGARLPASQLPLGVRIGERLRLGLRLPPESVDGLFRVEARLTGMDQTGADVQFLDPPPPFQAALKAYLGVLDGLQAQLDQQERAYADRLAALDRASRNGAGLMATQVLRNYLDGLVAVLERQAQRAPSDAERTRIGDDAALLSAACRRQGLPVRLAADLLRLRPPPPPGPPQLLNDATTDLWLATRRLREGLEERLAAPGQQLAHLLARLGIRDVRPPWTPAALAEALEQAFADLDLSLPTRLWALDQAGELAAPVRDLYRALLGAWDPLLDQAD